MIKFLHRLWCNLQRAWMRAGGEHVDHVTIVITTKSFRDRVGRNPCMDCMRNEELFGLDAPLCDYDLDAWFDAILNDESPYDYVVFCDVC